MKIIMKLTIFAVIIGILPTCGPNDSGKQPTEAKYIKIIVKTCAEIGCYKKLTEYLDEGVGLILGRLKGGRGIPSGKPEDIAKNIAKNIDNLEGVRSELGRRVSNFKKNKLTDNALEYDMSKHDGLRLQEEITEHIKGIDEYLELHGIRHQDDKPIIRLFELEMAELEKAKQALNDQLKELTQPYHNNLGDEELTSMAQAMKKVEEVTKALAEVEARIALMASDLKRLDEAKPIINDIIKVAEKQKKYIDDKLKEIEELRKPAESQVKPDQQQPSGSAITESITTAKKYEHIINITSLETLIKNTKKGEPHELATDIKNKITNDTPAHAITKLTTGLDNLPIHTKKGKAKLNLYEIRTKKVNSTNNGIDVYQMQPEGNANTRLYFCVVTTEGIKKTLHFSQHIVRKAGSEQVQNKKIKTVTKECRELSRAA